MDNLISKISEIEASASSVMDDMNARKAAFAKEIEQRTAEFDKHLEDDTARQLEELRAHMKAEMTEKLEKQEADGKKTLAALDHAYETTHSTLAAQLFQQMTKG